MHLIRLLFVSTLSSAVALSAATVGDLDFGVYIDSRAEYADPNQNANAVIDFRAEIELRLGWNIGEHVHAVVDIEHNNILEDPTVQSTADETTLEQAFIHWRLSDDLGLTFGKFSTWLGWEDTDPDNRWRVRSPFEWINHEQSVLPFAYPYRRLFYGIDEETGLVLAWQREEWSVAGYIIDEIWVPKNGTSKGSDQFGYGLEMIFRNEKLKATLQGSFESKTRDNGNGDDFGLIANADYAMTSTVDIATEIALFDYHFDHAIGGFVAVRSTANDSWRPSIQLSFMDTGTIPNLVSGALPGSANFLNNTKFYELASSIFYYPEEYNHSTRLGLEIAYQDSSSEVDDDAISLSIQFSAVIR